MDMRKMIWFLDVLLIALSCSIYIVLVGLTSREKKTNFENGITFDTWNHRGEGEKSEMISTAIEKTEGCIFTWLYDYLFSFTV